MATLGTIKPPQFWMRGPQIRYKLSRLDIIAALTVFVGKGRNGPSKYIDTQFLIYNLQQNVTYSYVPLSALPSLFLGF